MSTVTVLAIDNELRAFGIYANPITPTRENEFSIYLHSPSEHALKMLHHLEKNPTDRIAVKKIETSFWTGGSRDHMAVVELRKRPVVMWLDIEAEPQSNP